MNNPGSSLIDNSSIRSFILMLIITMGFISFITKTYNEPILENISLSVISSIGTFLISLVISVVFLLLVDSRQFNLIYLVNLVIYTMFFLGMYRLMIHMFRRIDAFVVNKKNTTSNNRVIIMGAGDAGKYLAEMLKNDATKKLYPVCFIDDNPALSGKIIKGLKVVGNRSLIPYAAEKYRVSDIIIAIPFVDNSTIRDIFRLCNEANCNVKRFGNMTTFTADGLSKATINEIRVEDLLGRDVVKLDLISVREYIAG